MSHKKLAVAVVLLCVGSAIGQTPSEFEKKYSKPEQNSEIAGILFSTPPDFKLEQASSARIAFMRNSEISLFVAV